MNIACPECDTVYRVDPDRIPPGGATARCRACDAILQIDPSPDPTSPGEVVTAARATPEGAGVQAADAGPHTAAEPAPEETAAKPETPGGDAPAAPAFGPQDPETRARRLARALVSDIKVYHPERWEEAAAAGTLRKDFRDEILKSWEEYVEQVGEKMAKKTPFFRDALNEILAEGDQVF